MGKKKKKIVWKLCSCKKNYAPSGTRCDVCLEKYFDKLDTYFITGTMVLRDEVREVFRKLDAEKMRLKKKLANLKKRK